METPMKKCTFYARNFSCLRAVMGTRNKLTEDLHFSCDWSAVEEELTKLWVEIIQKLDRHVKAIEEETHCMLFHENAILFTVTSIKIRRTVISDWT